MRFTADSMPGKLEGYRITAGTVPILEIQAVSDGPDVRDHLPQGRSRRAGTAQALAQWHVDQGISSTVNLPPESPLSAVDHLYRKAWESGCKGIRTSIC